MKLKIATILTLSSMAFTAHANEVILTSNQPTKITFRVAHKNINHQPVFGEPQSIDLDGKTSMPISLDHFDRAGIMIISVYDNYHQKDRQLPSSVTEFDKPEKCSMTTDKTKTTGELDFILTSHSISCHSEGGVFG